MPGLPIHAAGTAKQPTGEKPGASGADRDRFGALVILLSLRRAVAGALQHSEVWAPRTNGFAVLVGHNP